VADRAARHIGTDALQRVSLNFRPVLAALDGRRSLAPISSTAVALQHALLVAGDHAVFSAVCPPRVARMASGRSAAITFSTNSGVIGST